MKCRLLIPIGLTLSLLLPSPARADANSCTQSLIEGELSGGPFKYTGGDLVASEPYDGFNYHLIYLDAGGRKSQLVLRENNKSCERVLYNPLGDGPNFDQVMPGPVAKKLSPAARAYNQKIYEDAQALSKQAVEELRIYRENRAK